MIAACLFEAAAEPLAAQRFLDQLRPPRGKRFEARSLGSCLLAQVRNPLAPAPYSAPVGGWEVLFNGQLHNRAELARHLDLRSDEPAHVYASALERWNDQADEHCIGHYATIAFHPSRTQLRLARSPFQAPPLYFRHDGGTASVAPHGRSLFWNEAHRPRPDLERLAQTLINDHTDRYRAWYEGAFRLPLGTAIWLSTSGWGESWRYDLYSRPQVRLRCPQDYVDAALDLFDQGVKAALEGATRPAIMLSGGLDSAMVAAGALRQLPADRRLRAYTFGPEEGWDARPPPGMFLSDFPAVRAFAAANPRIDLTCETNQGRDFRYRLRELVEAADSAPAMLATSWIEHALFESAATAGCDVMLCGTLGNLGFSSAAPWAPAEYLRKGRLAALYQALICRHTDPRPAWHKLLGLAVMPHLPQPVWELVRTLRGQGADPLALSPLVADEPRLKAARARSRAAGFDLGRPPTASKRNYWSAILAEDGQEQGSYAQAMELLHGIPLRDPTAYRPLLEFCWGCPTNVFQRGDTDRWLAREMARGRLPEAQRTNRDYGRQFVDSPDRIARACQDLREELGLMAEVQDITSVLAVERIAELVERALPTGSEYDQAKALPYLVTVPLGMAAARFIAYANGRNDI